MQKLFLTLTLVFLSFVLGGSQANADNTYTPMLNDNAVWTIADMLSGTASEFRKYALDGTVEINGNVYRKLYYTENSETFDICEALYRCAIREDADGKVWVVLPDETTEILYIDFGAEVGDTMQTYGPVSYLGTLTSLTTITGKDSILVDGEYRDRLKVQIGCDSRYWIEGVGSSEGFLSDLPSCYYYKQQLDPIGLSAPMPEQNLICHEINGLVDYEINNLFDCNEPKELIFSGTFETTICKGEEVRVIPLSAYQGYVIPINEPNSINLKGGVLPYSYEIFPEDGVIEFGAPGMLLKAAPEVTTTYTVTVTDAFGSTNNKDFIINVIDSEIEEPIVLQQAFEDNCYVDSMLFYTTAVYDPSYTLTWTDHQDNVIATNTDSVVGYSKGYYRLTVENPAGCSKVGETYVFSFLDPNLGIENFVRPDVESDATGEECEGDIIKYWTTTSYDTYDWNMNNLGASDDTLFIAMPAGWFSVQVCVTSDIGCNVCSGTYSRLGTEVYDIPTIESDGTTLSTTFEASKYQWYYEDELIEGATNATYEPVLSGNYSLAISASSIFSSTFNCPTFSQSLFFDSSVQTVDLRVFLEGPYNENTGEMNTMLVDNCLLPVEQPYNVAPWYYTGTESAGELSSIPENAVDWVLVEVRSGIPDLISANTTVVSTVAALLLSDGSIVGADGRRLLLDNMQTGMEYYIAIRHRNHLDVVSANPIIAGTTTQYDFTTDIAQAFGPQQMNTADDGKAVLFAGDYQPDGIILSTDYDVWFLLPAVNQTYESTDGNLDGVVQATDYDYWFPNRSKVGIIEIQY